MRVKLTPSFIESNLVCPAGRRHEEFCDTEVPGLFIEVTAGPSANVTWNFRTKLAGKLQTRRLGKLGEFSLADARNQVRLLKAENALGRHAVKEDAEKGMTLDRFWTEHYLPHAAEYKRSLWRDKQLYDRRIGPEFGGVRLPEIKRLQVQQFQRKLSAEGLSPATVNHHLQLMRRLLNLALEWELLERNVLQRIKLLPLDNQRLASLSDAQIESLVQVLKTDENRLVCMVVLFLLSTGARLREGLSVRWDHVDFEKAMWTIPAANSKSKRMKHLPLNSSAIWALQQMTKKDDSPCVFASPVTGKPLTGITRTWYKLRRKAGLPPNFRIHDLRHAYASRLVSAGESLYVVQQLLGHADPRTTMRYAHLAMETQQRAANLAAVPLG